MSALNIAPPLSLYLHIPWCVRKCPYCDFNSHAQPAELPEAEYLAAIWRDLAEDLPQIAGREITTIFIGGGTPSLFSAASIGALLEGLAQRLAFAADIEITLEANPGTVDNARFRGFRAAGVNRLSLGVQSFDEQALQALGRIHDRAAVFAAVDAARAAGFENFNLDLMFGLPQQTPAAALDDLQQAMDLAPPHLSWYQLTLEPNTPFYQQPPPALPDDDALWEIQQAGQALLAERGWQQYEISAYAQPGRRCRHNLNYWQFGDYLALGAGAHGKLSTPQGVIRHSKQRHPKAYLEARGASFVQSERVLDAADLSFEFMLNALRLVDGVEEDLFAQRTGLELALIAPALAQARAQGWLHPQRLQATAQGLQFLNELLELFLPEN